MSILNRIQKALIEYQVHNRSTGRLVVYVGAREFDGIGYQVCKGYSGYTNAFIQDPQVFGSQVVRVVESTWLAIGPHPSGTQNGTITTPESNLQPRGDSGQ